MIAAKELSEMAVAFSEKNAHASIEVIAATDKNGISLGVNGYIDSGNSSDFSDIASMALEMAYGNGQLVFELSGLSYISSTGIGALTSLLPTAAAHSVQVCLHGASPSIKKVFDSLGFVSFFTFT
jgi:anti-anti-sigma factor